ncbi:sulfurtransferase TusA family protein [bacterium]|nr:sulfurtransferase TusA family protein [bacterium]
MTSTYELDITRDHCPMTFVKTKLKLESIPPGARLKVRLNPGEPLTNVPKTAAEQGYCVIGVVEDVGNTFIVEIEKPLNVPAGA